MSTSTPLDVVNDYFQALAQGRVAEAMALLAPDVVWHQPGANRFSGDHTGPEQVGALIGAMMEASGGTLAVVPQGPAMGNGELVAVPVRFSGRREGADLDQAGVDLLTVRDGRIVEVHLFSQDGPAEDEFWGRA
ncbi:nuclear transport factor 2 family protein [Actinomyces capricornis]|uniref:Ketosteroid isomerase n=1 Tax=Actinomyces capricornis TaxID=2755559 RepID=A0ABN6K1N8_9ACTO|nr:nuclear transport factor 2 family protein [Actinomyces capricornis]BDA63535.1 ketosteroid isomerase [Actinomyces capricornis]